MNNKQRRGLKKLQTEATDMLYLQGDFSSYLQELTKPKKAVNSKPTLQAAEDSSDSDDSSNRAPVSTNKKGKKKNAQQLAAEEAARKEVEEKEMALKLARKQYVEPNAKAISNKEVRSAEADGWNFVKKKWFAYTDMIGAVFMWGFWKSYYTKAIYINAHPLKLENAELNIDSTLQMLF